MRRLRFLVLQRRRGLAAADACSTRAPIGDLAPLAAQTIMMARQIGDQLASGMQNSVICSEDEPFFAPSASTGNGSHRPTRARTNSMRSAEICKLWPRGPVDADLHSALHSDVPTLLLSGEADPVTPPADAERAAQGLAHHRHLVLGGEGHGQLATGCVPQADGGVPRRAVAARRSMHAAWSGTVPRRSSSAWPGPRHDRGARALQTIRHRGCRAARSRSRRAMARSPDLLGPNGAGKSTCLRMLYGVLTPDSGSACIDGIDIRGETSAARAHSACCRTPPGYTTTSRLARTSSISAPCTASTSKRLRERTAELARPLGMEDVHRPARQRILAGSANQGGLGARLGA